jgi:hypothetical protein
MTGNTRVCSLFRAFLSFLGFTASAWLRPTQELELIVEEMHKPVADRWLTDIAPAACHSADLIPLALAVAVALADTTERANE